MLLRIQKSADGSYSALINNVTARTFLHATDIADYINSNDTDEPAEAPETPAQKAQREQALKAKAPAPVAWKGDKLNDTKAHAK